MRFGTSWHCPQRFVTNFLGSSPMRQVPCSWICPPGIEGETCHPVTFPPAASMSRTPHSTISRVMAFSFSPNTIWILAAGIPQMSFTSGSRSTKLSGLQTPSPEAPALTEVPDQCFLSLLYDGPKISPPCPPPDPIPPLSNENSKRRRNFWERFFSFVLINGAMVRPVAHPSSLVTSQPANCGR